MNIRLAVPDDIAAIAALHAANWRISYKDILSNEYLARQVLADRQAVWSKRFESPKANQYVIVAERKGRLVAFACALVNEHSQWGALLDNLHVDLPAQGQGVGSALLCHVAQRCEKETPGRGLYLSVVQRNLGAQGFYVQLGARKIQADVWQAPDGASVPIFLFRWDSVAPLATRPPYPPSSR